MPVEVHIKYYAKYDYESKGSVHEYTSFFHTGKNLRKSISKMLTEHNIGNETIRLLHYKVLRAPPKAKQITGPGNSI